jgi:hypothetical protein
MLVIRTSKRYICPELRDLRPLAASTAKEPSGPAELLKGLLRTLFWKLVPEDPGI